MRNNKIHTINMHGWLLWAFMLCVAWFGNYNGWWPIAVPITFTVIVCSAAGLSIILLIVTCALTVAGRENEELESSTDVYIRSDN